jgi:hypothetical protein
MMRGACAVKQPEYRYFTTSCVQASCPLPKDALNSFWGQTGMPRKKHGLLSRRASQKSELINQILNFGEIYHGRQITASSEADLIAQALRSTGNMRSDCLTPNRGKGGRK